MQVCEQLVIGGGLNKVDLATAYRWLGDATRAHAYALRNDPPAAKPLHARVREAYDKSIKLNPRDPETYERRATIHERYDTESTIADFSKAIELGTTNTTVYVLRAQSYQSQGKLDLAIADLTGAIKLQPYSDLYSDRAQLHYKTGAYEKALADIDAALEKKPSPSATAKLHELRGLVQNAMGKSK
jgi:tetratricopeptide (TPR) repeat protein